MTILNAHFHHRFAHPDVLILLTVSNYYLSGLTVAQLRSVFVKLNALGTVEADRIYEQWVAAVGFGDAGSVGSNVGLIEIILRICE